MDLAKLPLFGALTRKMNWLTAREKVLAENVANVNTPNYKASDLRPLDFRQELASVQPKLQPVTTDPKHLTGTVPARDVALETQTTEEARNLDGNTVSIEDEMLKVSQTAADYQLMTNLYRKQVGILKEAIGRGGS